MSLATRLQTSWELMQSSVHVLRRNPRLVLFPIVSAACSVFLALFFFMPVIGLIFGSGWTTADQWEEAALKFKQLFYAYGVLIYLVSLFVATFFNVAFYNEIMRALAGEPVSVANGLRFASTRLRSILMWSLLAGTVGIIIRMIEERLGWLGKTVMAFVGTVWSVAAVFAIPVIIRQGNPNPFAVLRDSAITLKKTWGESLAGFIGIQLGSAVILVGCMIVMILGIVGAAFFHLSWLGVLIAVTAFLAMLAAGFVLNVATHIYRCALYVYASEGVVPEPFTPELMNAGWKIKQA